MAGQLEPADYVYFGEHAYPLAQHWLEQQWLEQQVQKSKQAEDADDVFLPIIPKAYWTMMGMPTVMPHKRSIRSGCVLGAEAEQPVLHAHASIGHDCT